jgi:hypothetical protein
MEQGRRTLVPAAAARWNVVAITVRTIKVRFVKKAKSMPGNRQLPLIQMPVTFAVHNRPWQSMLQGSDL